MATPPPPTTSPLSRSPSPKTRSQSLSTDLHALQNPSHIKMVTLSPPDLAIVRHAIGARVDDETNALITPTSKLHPPKGLPEGLYRDVVSARNSAQWQYRLCSVFYSFSLVLQILLGAILTALSSTDSRYKGTIITVLAATNTVNAGMLALMHNSGLPDRFKNDALEFEKVEMYLEELMHAGIAPQGVGREDLIADAFDRFARARGTVARNRPGNYSGSEGVKSGGGGGQ